MAVAISPVAIVAVIMMLLSGSAARNSISFLIGWLVSITGVVIVVLAIGGLERNATSRGYARIAIGVALFAVAVRRWHRRPGPDEEPELPTWMSSIDELTAVKAVGVRVLLSFVNPKNFWITVAAGLSIAAGGLDVAEETVVVAVFLLVASITVIVPVVGYAVAPRRVEPVLGSLRQWLIAHDAAVMTVLLILIGAKLFGDGISDVLG